MKLEERNNELEKKLTSNNFNSKENSLNDSFNFNTAAGLSLDDLTSSAGKISTYELPKQLPLNANSINSFINNNISSSIPNTNVVLNGCNPATKASLKNIPNINQGGFIITSTGSISYVPPSNATSTPNCKPQPATSSFASSSNDTQPDELKFDLDCLSAASSATYHNKNSINLDLSSLFTSKNILNLNASKASPSVSPNKTGSTDKHQATAFILSANGQLVPITNPISAPTVSQSSSMPYILPKPNILPKPSTGPVLAPKPTKSKATKLKPIKSKPVATQIIANNSQQADSVKPNELSIQPQPILIAPAPPITTSTNVDSLNKHRAIRPKPIAPLSGPITTKHKAIVPKPLPISIQPQPQVFVLPANTSPSKLSTNYGIIKINTISPGKSLMETNDILSKAASMIFSPSEFTLNNLSPSTTTTNNVNNNPISTSSTSPGTFLLQNTNNSETPSSLNLTPPGTF